MSDFHGVFPYLVSPLDPGGQVREDVLARLADDLIKAGVHGLTPLGSTASGETAGVNFAAPAIPRRTTTISVAEPVNPHDRCARARD